MNQENTVQDDQQPCCSSSITSTPTNSSWKPTNARTIIRKERTAGSSGSKNASSPYPINHGNMDKTPDIAFDDDSDDSMSSSGTVVPHSEGFDSSRTEENRTTATDEVPDTFNDKRNQQSLPSFQSTFGQDKGIAQFGGNNPYSQYAGQNPYFTAVPMLYPNPEHANFNPNGQQNGPYVSGNPLNAESAGSYAPKCMANEIYSFMKTCILDLNITLSSKPASRKISSCIRSLEEASKEIQKGEDSFRQDSLNNGHKNHSRKFCEVGKKKKAGKSRAKGTDTSNSNSQTTQSVDFEPLTPGATTDGDESELEVIFDNRNEYQ